MLASAASTAKVTFASSADSNEVVPATISEILRFGGHETAPLDKHRLSGARAVVNDEREYISDTDPTSGIVVGWGSVEKFGDNAASQKFLRELNKKKMAAIRNANRVNSTNVVNATHRLKSSTDMNDVLRLRKVELPFIDRNTCEQWYASRARPIKLIEAQFCAGLYEGGKDACRVSH